jgi:hypothetical protein
MILKNVLPENVSYLTPTLSYLIIFYLYVKIKIPLILKIIIIILNNKN